MLDIKKTILKKPASTSGAGSAAENKGADKAPNGPPPGPVVSSSLNPKRSVKGAPSSFAVGKRKRDEKPRAISVEEAAALKAREAARKRERERERERNHCLAFTGRNSLAALASSYL
ncbi:hypothetical protein C1H46_024883 [Malus baccata]|uniref:Uncharacterized protein n=1 Tax=Malus baccata TaxID=106549 RepID=A0A540LT12_MALBA|nr:hypothetical protein C1H46_024883 [Malus baccata]